VWKPRNTTIASAALLGWIASNSAQANPFDTCMENCRGAPWDVCDKSYGLESIDGPDPGNYQHCLDVMENKCKNQCARYLQSSPDGGSGPPCSQRGCIRGIGRSQRPRVPWYLPSDWYK